MRTIVLLSDLKEAKNDQIFGSFFFKYHQTALWVQTIIYRTYFQQQNSSWLYSPTWLENTVKSHQIRSEDCIHKNNVNKLPTKNFYNNISILGKNRQIKLMWFTKWFESQDHFNNTVIDIYIYTYIYIYIYIYRYIFFITFFGLNMFKSPSDLFFNYINDLCLKYKNML